MTLPPPPSGEVVRGWTNVPLAPKGESEAEKLAKDIKGSNLVMTISSDLERTLETAKIIEKLAGIPLVAKSPELRTWGLGELEGSPLKDSMKLIREYVVQRPNDKPKGGESFNQFVRRVLNKVQQGMDVFYPKGISVIYLTHHWVIEVVYAWIEAGSRPDYSMNKQNLFLQGQEPPSTVHDVWEESEKGKRYQIKRVMVDKQKAHKFYPGPVLIRHASTAWNVGGKG